MKVFSGATGEQVRSFLAFDSTMTAGVRTATAFVDDDPYADIIVGTGEGVTGTAKVFGGADSAELATPMSPYTPFGSSYTGGLYVGGSNDPDTVSVAVGAPSPGSVPQGGSVTLTATVTDGVPYNGQQTPTGTVTFTTSGGAVTLGTGTLVPSGTGKATATVVVDPVTLPPSYGIYMLAANYGGDGWFLSGTGNGYGFYVTPPLVTADLDIIDSAGVEVAEADEETSGGWVAVNNDNDNYNFVGNAATSVVQKFDKDETTKVDRENDLLKITVHNQNTNGRLGTFGVPHE